MTEYAIVEHGGKQYRVCPGDILTVERTEADLKAGDSLSFDKVMLLSRDDELQVGRPLVEGAVVRTQIIRPIRGRKVLVFKKKRRKGYKKMQGHRQDYYSVRVESIEA